MNKAHCFEADSQTQQIGVFSVFFVSASPFLFVFIFCISPYLCISVRDIREIHKLALGTTTPGARISDGIEAGEREGGGWMM